MQFLWLGKKSPRISVLVVLPEEKIENGVNKITQKATERDG